MKTDFPVMKGGIMTPEFQSLCALICGSENITWPELQSLTLLLYKGTHSCHPWSYCGEYLVVMAVRAGCLTVQVHLCASFVKTQVWLYLFKSNK